MVTEISNSATLKEPFIKMGNPSVTNTIKELIINRKYPNEILFLTANFMSIINNV
jgi:hypothetical protein